MRMNPRAVLGLSNPLSWISSTVLEMFGGKSGAASKRATSKKSPSHLCNDVKPWPMSVDGSELLNELVTGYNEYLTLVPYAAETMALWVINTHAFKAAPCNPRLVFKSAEKRSGKTSSLRLIADTAARPLSTANITPAAIYRIIEKEQPTLLIDEADTFATNKVELTGILNSGHTEAYAYVMRTVGHTHYPKRFSTWSPMALAVIKKLPGTLEDRSIVIPMHRQTAEERKRRKRLRGNRPSDLVDLNRKAARWARDHINELGDADPELPDELDDRAADNWEPLLAIADAAGVFAMLRPRLQRKGSHVLDIQAFMNRNFRFCSSQPALIG